MADEGTLATSAQVILAIGDGAGATQILEANTNYWIKFAEQDMSIEAKVDLVGDYASITPVVYKQWLAAVASARAAFYAIQQNQDNWQLAVTQSKLNVIDNIWQDFKKRIQDTDVLARMGLAVDD